MKRRTAARWVLFSLLLSCPAIGQDRLISPTRGFQPAHSYSLDNIESIDKGTGSLSLHIPITQLPPGPAGFTAGVTLSYSTRYWEAEEVSDSPIEYDLKTTDIGGGWLLSMIPQLEMRIVPMLSLSDPCQSGTANDLARLTIINQDGSRNLLYRSTPAVTQLPSCAGSYLVHEMNTVDSNWYSADGSFLHLVINAPAPTAAGNWPDNASWTLYRQDGSSVIYDPVNKFTYLQDRNGNQIKFQKGIQSGVGYEQMTDSLQRSIRIDHYTSIPIHDTITQTAHDGTPLTWTVNWDGFPAITQPTTFKSRPTGNGALDFNSGPLLVSSLQLPNNLSYSFGYTASRYRELADLTLPTGATVHYGYRLDSNANPVYYHQILANTIASKVVTHDGTSEAWQYSYEVGSTGTYSIGTMTAPDGGQSEYEFNAISYQYSALPLGGTLTRIVNPDGSETRREWQFNRPAELPAAAPAYPNQWVQRELTTVSNSTPSTLTTPSGQLLNLTGTPIATSIQVFTVDKNGNSTSKAEYGWVAYTTNPPSTPSAPLRKTISAYVNPSSDSTSTVTDGNAYSHPNVSVTPRNMMASTEVQSAAGAVVSRSEFGYTELSPARTVGNLVDEYHWDSTKVASISSGTVLTTGNAIHRSYTYTAKGNLNSETDARSNVTSYTYVSGPGCATDLYRTGMSRGGNGSIVQNSSYGYNCNSGLRTSAMDPNSLTTTIGYDRYGRPTTFTEGSIRTTTHEYNDGSRWIVTRNDAEAPGDQRSVSVLHFDQLGRVRLSRQLETQATNSAAAADETLGIKADTKYVFATGRNDVLVSNPYRQSEASAATRGWTVTRHDKAGRVCLEETFAGAADPSVSANCTASAGTTGKTIHSYNATVNYRSVTVTDAAGAVRTMYHDVLGRLIAILEDPSVLKYATYYGYDARDNLTDVRQAGACAQSDPVANPCPGGTARSFGYSSLNRLLSAVNPESGTTQYAYDAAGNLVRRQQGTVVRCHGTRNGDDTCQPDGYDDLNRLRLQTYNDGTPPVTYAYDTAQTDNKPANCAATDGAIGRLASVGNSVSTNYYFYNKLGYVQCNRQKTGGSPYDFRYSTTPQGEWTQMVYPSGRTVNTPLDDAGRIMSATATSNYASSLTYEAHGGIRQLTLGNLLVEKTGYNSRLQAILMQLGTSGSPSSVWQLENIYSSTGNNGNIPEQKVTLPLAGWSAGVSTVYRYDGLNRLTLANERPTNLSNPVCQDAGSHWCQQYGYEERGNRLIVQRDNTGQPANEPGSFGADNRISSANWQYSSDGRGNLAKNPSNETFAYDGESRQTAYCTSDLVSCPAQAGAGRTLYKYDGEGRRVQKDGVVFVYDARGQLAAEYGATAASSGPNYVTGDHLGSTRVVTDGNQVVVTRRDYLPFGEEISANVRNERNGVPGFASDGGVRLKFTSKERDAETGLDYFGARYFSGAQARFTSPDPPILDQHIYDPQSWNLYTYARNNPLRFVDSTGNAIKLLGDEEQREEELALLKSQMSNRKAAELLYINPEKDKNGNDTGRYFVGISGDIGKFMGMSSAAHDLANLVKDNNIVEFGLTSRNLAEWGGAVTFEKGEAAKYGMPANQNVQVLVNPDQMDIANRRLMTPNVLGATRFAHQFQQPTWHIYDYNTGLATFHEFGHAWGFIHGRVGAQTNQESIDWENRLREQLYGPLGRYNARRIAH